jgi:hypothetical protein
MAPLQQKATAQARLLFQLDEMLSSRAGYPAADVAQSSVPTAMTGREQLAECDAMDERLGRIVHWLGTSSDDPVSVTSRKLIGDHLRSDLQRQLALTPRPLFAEISRGRNSTHNSTRAEPKC